MSQRNDGLHAAAVALGLLLLYAATAPRSVALEDDAFFILSSAFQGVAHPPGYPLHSMLGGVAAFLPFGSVAWRIHLLSGLCGAAACAVLWLCARSISHSRLAAWVAALGLGLSPAFWSQAIIAEVYTLNALLFFLLLLLALRGGALPAMALLFGLSLANHWPLMLLCAPALAVLLWPRRAELLRRLPLLLGCLLAGLLPYAWMVWRSRYSPIAFYGPIESLQEFWFYVSRQGYAQADVSPTAGWFDRLQFFGYLARQLLIQFALIGTLAAAAGFAWQWQRLERRVAWALCAAFVMPSFALLLLLGFDYDALHQALFYVYPLPAYGIVALWMGAGCAWLAERRAWRQPHQAVAAALLLACIAGMASRTNLRSGYDWAERYALAVLDALPRNATLVMFGDADMGPISYFHLVEERRDDLTLHHSQSLVLGNRLFHPMRTRDAASMQAALRRMVHNEPGPVAFMQEPPAGLRQTHQGLFILVDGKADGGGRSIAITPEALRFFDDAVMDASQTDPWTRLVQQRLRARFGALIASQLDPAGPRDPAMARRLALLEADFSGALGVAEGLLAGSARPSPGEVARYLERARERMPGDAAKDQRARYFELRAYLRLEQGDATGAVRDLEIALQTWPSKDNKAAAALADLRARAGG